MSHDLNVLVVHSTWFVPSISGDMHHSHLYCRETNIGITYEQCIKAVQFHLLYNYAALCETTSWLRGLESSLYASSSSTGIQHSGNRIHYHARSNLNWVQCHVGLGCSTMLVSGRHTDTSLDLVQLGRYQCIHTCRHFDPAADWWGSCSNHRHTCRHVHSTWNWVGSWHPIYTHKCFLSARSLWGKCSYRKWVGWSETQGTKMNNVFYTIQQRRSTGM